MECIAVWNKCNNRCLMCSNPSNYGEWGDYSFRALISRFKKINPKEKDIYLTGGEPTLHPDFFELLNFLRKRCPEARIIIDTNARMFFYKDFLSRCLNYGNLEFQVSLCGHNAALHDKITGINGSFEQTIQGLKNLVLLGVGKSNIEMRVVIHKLTLENLEKIYDFIGKTFPQIGKLIFIFMEIEGMAGKNIKKVGTTYKKANPYLKSLLKKIMGSKHSFEVRFYHFSLCVLPPKFWPYLWRTLPEKEISFLSSCKECLYKKYCLGIHKDYLKYIGEKEFMPIIKKIKIEATNNFYHPIAAIN